MLIDLTRQRVLSPSSGIDSAPDIRLLSDQLDMSTN